MSSSSLLKIVQQKTTYYADDEPIRPLDDGPEENGWKPKLGTIPLGQIKTVKSLGDIHGWAPGLINYLIINQLAKISINGLVLYNESNNYLSLNEYNLKALFPNPLETIQAKDHFEQSGLLGFNPKQSQKYEKGFHSIHAEWVASDETAFVQIGDIYDRGDYSELACEILRQLVIQAPFRVFILIGNHEQFFLENDTRHWLLNESKYAFDPERKQNGFHSRFHADSYKWEVVNEDVLIKNVFNRYQISCVLLYLTQFVVQSKFNDLTRFGKEISHDIILQGGWKAYNYVESLLEKNIFKDFFPGAITILGLGHTLFVHAGPEGLSKLNFSELSSNTIRMNSSETVGIFFYYRLSENRGDVRESKDKPILWDRRGPEGVMSSVAPAPLAKDYMKNLIPHFQGLRHIVHGHTPTVTTATFVDLDGNYPVSYLARKYGELITSETSSIRIHIIDEGFTPVYYKGQKDKTFDPLRVPIGLRINKDLEKFQSSSSETLEEDKDLWIKIIHEDDSIDFEIPNHYLLETKNQIGRFKEGKTIFNKMIGDENDPDHRFLFDNSTFLRNYKLFRQSIRKETGKSGISYLIYSKENVIFEKPNKIYLLSKKQNIPIDRYIFDFLNNNFITWAKENQFENFFSYLKESHLEAEKEYSDIFNPEKILGSLKDVFKEKGIIGLIEETKLFFCSFFFDAGGQFTFIALNNLDIDLYFNFISIKGTTLNSNIAKSKKKEIEVFKFNNFSPPPIILNWNFDYKEKSDLTFRKINENMIKLNDENGTLLNLISNTRIFGGLTFFKYNQDFKVDESKFKRFPIKNEKKLIKEVENKYPSHIVLKPISGFSNISTIEIPINISIGKGDFNKDEIKIHLTNLESINAISGNQFKLKYDNSKLYIINLGSMNHTFVNNVKLEVNESRELKINDKITLANALLSFKFLELLYRDNFVQTIPRDDKNSTLTNNNQNEIDGNNIKEENFTLPRIDQDSKGENDFKSKIMVKISKELSKGKEKLDDFLK